MRTGEENANDEPVHIRVLHSSDVDDMIRLIGSGFSTAEPLGVAVGLTFADLHEFLSPLAPRAIDDGLTVVARSSATGEIVGALLTDDFAVPPPLDPQQLSPRFLPILTMLDSLDEDYRSARTIKPGEYLHLFMIAVDPRYGGRGIAQRLVESCLENGLHAGYRWAVTEATGVISQRVFHKLGFEELRRLAYRDFRYEGKPVFASITDQDGVALMEKNLAA